MNRLYLFFSLIFLVCLSLVFAGKSRTVPVFVADGIAQVRDEVTGGAADVTTEKKIIGLKTNKIKSPSKKKKKSYEEEILEEIEATKPSVDEIVKRTHLAGYLHPRPDLEEEMADEVCGDDDDTCEPTVLMWAAAPTDPKAIAEKKRKRALRDKDYADAVKKGQATAEKEIRELGGPDPYGGVVVPSLNKEERDMGSEVSKKRLQEEKGTKTFKGARKVKDKDDKDKKDKKDKAKDDGKKDKGKKSPATTTEEDVDVATAPAK